MPKWKDRLKAGLTRKIKIKAEAAKAIMGTIKMVAPERCTGSVKHPSCKMNYYHTSREQEIRNECIAKLLASEDPEDVIRGNLFDKQCIYCIAEDPSIWPDVAKGARRAIKVARSIWR